MNKEKMRRIILFVLFLAAMTCANAQPREDLTISGSLTDVDAKEPIEQATIQVFWAKDSSFVGGTLTDTRGNFSIDAPSNGTFRLRISSIGYQTIEREVTLRRNQRMAYS